jgi:hypothetical protein
MSAAWLSSAARADASTSAVAVAVAVAMSPVAARSKIGRALFTTRMDNGIVFRKSERMKSLCLTSTRHFQSQIL